MWRTPCDVNLFPVLHADVSVLLLAGLTKMVSRLGKEGAWRKALEIYQSLPQTGVCPDTAITNAAISACDKGTLPALKNLAAKLMQEAFSAVHTRPPFNGGVNHAYSNPIALQAEGSSRHLMGCWSPYVGSASENLCLQVGSGGQPWVSMRAWMPKGCDKMPSRAPASSVPWQRASNGPLHYRYTSISQHATDFVKPGFVRVC